MHELLFATRNGMTPRLQIEPLLASHASALFGVLDDDRIYRYVPTPRARSVEELAATFERLAAGAPPESGEKWLNWVLRRRTDGRYLGSLQATVVGGGRAWIGYLLDPTVWGQGFAGEGCAWLIETLRAHYGVHALQASVDARNTASIRLLRRLGFTHESTEPCALHGEATTDHVYGLTLEPAPAVRVS